MSSTWKGRSLCQHCLAEIVVKDTISAALRSAVLKALVTVSAVLLTSCSLFETTATSRDFSNRPYVGAGVLVSHVKPDTRGVAGTSVDESVSAGGSLTLGYDLNNRFSVEGHIANLGEATLDPSGSIGYTVGGVSGVVYGLNEVRDRSRRERFAVYGKLGLGAMENSASGVDFKRVNDVHLLAALGLEYGLSNGVGIRAELVAHETDAKYAQLGLVYRFGDTASAARAPVSPVSTVDPTLADDVPIGGPGASDLPAVPAGSDTPAIPASSDTPLTPATPETATTPAVPSTQASQDLPPASASGPAPSQVATIIDADGDKVPDSMDRCPDTDAGAPVKKDGCPILDGVVEGINFEPGSATLTEEANAVLAGVAQTLRDYPEVRVVIEAYTDNVGSAASNLQLSRRRAIAVARYLVEAGISGSRLKPQAFGESNPRATNLTPLGRAANRRVEFSILQ
jgi:OOP family OmpA-OmpF porin